MRGGASGQLSRSRVLASLAAVCALALAPSALAALFGAWPFDGDALAAFGPWHLFAAQSLRGGVLPLWNPRLYCGTPFMANGQSGVLYPPNLIYLWLPVRAALVTDALLHDILLACGGYCLARALGLGRLSSWVAAVCLAVGGAVSAHLYAGHLTWNAARAYIPWELWALLLYLRGGKTSYLWLLAPLAALQLAAGSPPVCALAGELCLGLLAARMVSSLAGRRGSGLPRGWWWQLPACAGLAGALGAAALLPLAEFSRLSMHGAGMSYSEVVSLSGSWRSLVRLLAPDFFGGNGTSPQWSAPFSPHEEEAYIGVLGLWLALCAPWIARREVEPGRRLEATATIRRLEATGTNLPRAVGWLWALLPVAALLAMGGSTPLYRPLFAHLALFRMTRVPARWFELWYFAAALLAGFAFDGCFVRRREAGDSDGRVRPLIAALYGTAAVAVIAAIVAFVLPAGAHGWGAAVDLFHAADSIADKASDVARFRSKAATAAFTAGIIALLAATIVGQWVAASTAAGRRRVELKLAGLIALDLLFASISSMQIVSAADYSGKLQWPAALVNRYRAGERWDTQVEDEREMDQGMPLGIDLYNGYDPLSSSRYFQFVQAMEPNRTWGGVYQPWDRTPLLLTTGTGFTIVAPHLDGSPTTPPVGDLHPVPIVRANKWTLWHWQGAWPRAYLTRRLVRTEDDRQLQVLGSLSRHPFRHAGDEGGPVVVKWEFVAIPHLPIDAGEGVMISRPNVNEVRLDAFTRAPAVVVLADSWYPGWQAWVNGSPAYIAPANFLFRASTVPAGQSRVDWVYNSEAFRFGMFWSLVGMSLLSGIWLVHRR